MTVALVREALYNCVTEILTDEGRNLTSIHSLYILLIHTRSISL
jgi:hypothetical protein